MLDWQKEISQLPERISELQGAHYFPSLDSTNLKARALGREDIPAPFVVVAGAQTAGRGRMGRSWESPSELGLYFSLWCRPELSPSEAPLLTLATGLAIKRVLLDLGIPNPLIKWPNDILVNGKKVSGVLAEMDTQRNEILGVILGVGINLFEEKTDFPEELQEIAGSLKAWLKDDFNLIDFLGNILSGIFSQIHQIEKDHGKALIQAWEQESGIIGQSLKVERAGQSIQGEVQGLSPEGHLKLKTPEGKVLALLAEDTTLI